MFMIILEFMLVFICGPQHMMPRALKLTALYGALREDERPAKGLKPPKPNGTLSVAEAIERGSKDAPSNYVHATRDLLVAAHFAISSPCCTGARRFGSRIC